MSNAQSSLNHQQLALAIQIQEGTRLEDFCWTNNELLHKEIHALLHGNSQQILYLWGNHGSGKSHLLQACCQELLPASSAAYLPLQILKEWGPEAIEDMEQHHLLCIDDIDVIAGNPEWEETLFHLYNRVKDKEDSLLIFSGKLPPATLQLSLPDLKSRLSWGLVLQMHELNDEDKIKTLQHHAQKRGFHFPSNVGQFLITRCSRNMHDLNQLLNHLDEASLAAQRKITIPFVKSALGI